MSMWEFKIAVFALLLLTGGVVRAETDKTNIKQIGGYAAHSRDPDKTEAQTQIEQAADQFDAFALQMPAVIKDKFSAFMKRGFRAILIDDYETKPAEERMIQSLVNGLHNIGNAIEEDMIMYESNRQFTPLREKQTANAVGNEKK